MDLAKNGKNQLDGKITNEEVWERIEEKKSLINTIRTRQKKWIGHVLRGESNLLREVLEGKMKGKAQKGRPRTSMLEWMFDTTEKNKYSALKIKAQDREAWRRWSMEPVLGQSTRRRRTVG